MDMLTLTRREGEELIFQINGLEFSLMLTKIKGSEARISVNASHNVRVLRKELVCIASED